MRESKTAKVIEKFNAKRRTREAEAELRLSEIHDKIPETEEIDRALRATSINILNAVSSGDDANERFLSLKENVKELRARRSALLTAAGYPADYTDVRFDCPRCSDTGYDGLEVCACMKRELAAASFEDSGIGNLVKTQSFETFDLSYYKGEDKKYTEMNFRRLRDFAESFSDLSCETQLRKTTALSSRFLSIHTDYLRRTRLYRPKGFFLLQIHQI